ncbi:xanthine dehydrogenase family protein subunit M [Roseicyclus sp. F158]|uniref:Xanthine dehydrogenase family protein subunit M n=1 Tax=Tropicimonas omnivorans TaxID=3075590 RepID=A0ABU3DL74_9RHOB|nr:xanthine dehydrogenase family protein subunit M [Roseicyclus sp. F158]MDT0683877.1 xanthine dehydrogenase family protein subunit M [Roseicyclus sp. F158]
MYDFEFMKPTSLDEAVAALAEEDAQLLAGGQTLLPTMKQRLAMPSRLVSLNDIPGFAHVTADGDALTIGGGTTHRQVSEEAESAFPGLASLAGRIGDPAVRNRGTIGGSLANNDPAACYPAAVLATGAMVITNRREIAADDYFQGMFTTALDEGEIVTAVRFPVPEASRYEKFAQPASRFPMVACFVAKMKGDVRVAVTGASEEGVFRWSEAEEALTATFSADALDGLAHPANGMISDIHGSGEYRAHLIGVMTKRAVLHLT